MGPLLGLLGTVGIAVGVVALIRPIRWLRIGNRKQAGWVLGASLVLFSAGIALTPTEESLSDEAADSSTTVAPATSIASPTTTQPSLTTTSTDATTTTTAALTTTTAQALPPGSDIVAVVSVTDGDTIDVRFSDGTVDAVRLIGINSPEGGECFAAEATDALESLLSEDILMTSDVSDRDQYDRLLRYLWLADDVFVNEALVLGGFAIARDYPPDSQYADRLAAAESEAEASQIGLWAPDACGPAADSDLQVGHIEYDAPGNDHENLNGEWVDIVNRGDGPQDMTGWVLKDETASHRYRFPSAFVLNPGATVSIHTGCGSDTSTALYWCNGNAVWNNDGDTAFLVDANGNIVHQSTYEGGAATPATTIASTTTASPATSTTANANCHPSYPTVCIPPPPPDLDCGEISHRRFEVVGSDPHRFDGDNDGIGCES